MLLSFTIVDFHLLYDGAVGMQIWALLTRSQCRVSDTQLTVKASGLLVKFYHCIFPYYLPLEQGKALNLQELEFS